MNMSSTTRPARTKKFQPHSWTRAGLLAWLLWAGCPAEAEIVQTNWVRQLGWGAMYGAVYSPKGEAILTYGILGAFLWSAHDGALLRRFPGVGTPAFSPDGTMILLGSSEGVGRLWSVADGTVLRTFPVNPGYNAPAFSADGTKALIGGKLWSVTNGALLQTVMEGAVAISPNGVSVLAIKGYAAVAGGRILSRVEQYSLKEGTYLGCIEGCGRYGLEQVTAGYASDGTIITFGEINGVGLTRGNGPNAQIGRVDGARRRFGGRLEGADGDVEHQHAEDRVPSTVVVGGGREVVADHFRALELDQ